MMKHLTYKRLQILGAVALAIGFQSCIQQDENSPGWEYMPDMYRSPAIEAYVDYGEIRDTLQPELNQTMSARLPVSGTIPYSANALNDLPYPFPPTNEGYEAAGAQLRSPLVEDEAVLARGKTIYSNYCMQCHGEGGQGDGLVVTNGGHPPPGAYDGPLKDLPEGKMFHSITYGKGMMGPHRSLLTKEERWQVVAYVKVLQRGGEEPEASPADSTNIPISPGGGATN